MAFNDYQLRLEQALAVRAATVDGTRGDFLNGEREIITGMLHLCLNEPENITTRILLLETLRRMKEVRPEIVNEFRDKMRKLEQEQPVPQLACKVLYDMLAEIFAMGRQSSS